MKTALICLAFVVSLFTTACSSIASSAPEVGTAPFTVRVSLPMFTPFNSNVFPAGALSTTGGPGSSLGLVVQIPTLPVGSTIIALEARVRDSAIGPTRAAVAFADQVDGGFQETGIAQGQPSSGVGGPGFQTIALPVIVRVVQPLHVYYAGVFLASGAQPVAVSAIDVIYQPPATAQTALASPL